MGTINDGGNSALFPLTIKQHVCELIIVKYDEISNVLMYTKQDKSL